MNLLEIRPTTSNFSSGNKHQGEAIKRRSFDFDVLALIIRSHSVLKFKTESEPASNMERIRK